MRASKLIDGVVWNYAGALVFTASGFLLTPILIHRLGHGRYGAYALMGDLLGYAGLLDFGVGLATTRAIAEQVHLEDRRGLQAIVTNALVLFSAMGALALGIGIGVSFNLQRLFKLRGVGLTEFREAFLICLLALALTFPSGIFAAVTQGHGDFGFQNVLGIVRSFVTFGLSVLVLYLGGGLIMLAVVNAGAALLVLLARYAYSVKHYHLGWQLQARSLRGMVALVQIGGYILLTNLIVAIVFDTDNVVVGSVLGTVAVAAYSVAAGPASALRQIGDQFNTVSLSAASSLNSQSRRDDLKRLLMESTRMTTIVVLSMFLVFVSWGHELLRLWVGPSFRDSYWTLVILSLGMLATAVQGTASQVLIAFHRQRTTAWVAVLEAASNLGLSIVLAMHIGIVGVAIGTTLPTCLSAFGVYVPFASHLVGLPVWAVYRRLFLPCAVFGAGFLILHFGLGPVSFPDWAVLALAAIPVVALSLMASVALDPKERGTYVAYLRLRLGTHRSPSTST